MRTERGFIDDAIELLEKSNADLEPELLPAEDAQRLLEAYARAEKLAAFGLAALARKVQNTPTVAKAAGISLGRAKETVATGEMLVQAPELSGVYSDLLNAALSEVDWFEIADAMLSGAGLDGYEPRKVETERR